MVHELRNKCPHEFAYIAFDFVSGKAMAYGQRAIDALDSADRIGPDLGIVILATGAAGQWIWIEKISLEEAKTALDKMSPISDWIGPTNF